MTDKIENKYTDIIYTVELLILFILYILKLRYLDENTRKDFYYYEFSDSYEQGIKRLETACENAGKKVEITNTRKVKSISPDEWHVAIDGKIFQN